MLMVPAQRVSEPAGSTAQRHCAMIDYLRSIVSGPLAKHERGHAVFVDAQSIWLGDATFGMGNSSSLSLRMRELFSEALRLRATGVILAHNHPSGDCRPSQRDIAATKQLQAVARALDITLIDHLIFTTGAVYSMRAGGML